MVGGKVIPIHLLCIFALIISDGLSSQYWNHQAVNDIKNIATHHEIITPQLVDEEGTFLSYFVSYDYAIHNFRKKRSVESHSNFHHQLFYKLHINSLDVHINLTSHLRLTSKNYVVEIWGRNKIKEKHRSIKTCHYGGFVIGYPNSKVIISNCFGIHGTIHLENDVYIIEPIWNHTNDIIRKGHPHVVYPCTSFKVSTYLCKTLDFKQFKKKKKKKRKKFVELKPESDVRVKRSFSIERYVETLVVADKKMIAYHGEKKAEYYILTIMNIVAQLFRDASIGNAINIIVTRLVLLTEDQPTLEIGYHAGNTLRSFCQWQNNINPAQNSSDAIEEGLAHHDNALLITRYDICFDKNEPCDTLGLAQVAGMCEPERSCSVNQDIGLVSGFTIAHELGHNFGMQHDGTGNNCGKHISKGKAHLMATKLSLLSHPITWSSCSRQYISDFLDSGQGDCMKNAPPFQDFNYHSELPGERFGIAEQCQSQYGARSVPCKDKRQQELCKTVWCRGTNNRCTTNNIPVLDGTSCNNSKYKKGWCYKGNCVEYGTHPKSVDGNWNMWTDWGECSRTCGGGIKERLRFCTNPKPENGGKFCTGERKQYKSCNIKTCPSNAEDFRAVQCASYNEIEFRGKFYNWVPYVEGHTRHCSLYCQAEGFNFFVEKSTKVVDGTPCMPNSHDVCVNGQCKHVGCDRLLNSKAIEDRCRICGGNGSACKTVNGTIDDKLSDSINKYQTVVRIPKGAVHITIKELKITKNFLALKSFEGTFFLNGKWIISWPATYDAAGTRFLYTRDDLEPESLQALGPTSDELFVMMLVQEENQGIYYQYNIPVPYKDEEISVNFHWIYLRWSACSKSCSKGISEAEIVCVREDDKSTVDDHYCDSNQRLPIKRIYCNTMPCPPKWRAGDWSVCSQTCDEGTQFRNVLCFQRIDDVEEKILEDAHCLSKRPLEVRQCYVKSCPKDQLNTSAVFIV